MPKPKRYYTQRGTIEVCKIKGCKKKPQGRGYCSKHYKIYGVAELGVKCKVRGCKNPAWISTKTCDGHRQVERCRSLIDKGLCKIVGCRKIVAERKLVQGKRVMHSHKTRFCFWHLRNAAKWHQENRPSRAVRCAICHKNPAEPCVACLEEKK